MKREHPLYIGIAIGLAIWFVIFETSFLETCGLSICNWMLKSELSASVHALSFLLLPACFGWVGKNIYDHAHGIEKETFMEKIDTDDTLGSLKLKDLNPFKEGLEARERFVGGSIRFGWFLIGYFLLTGRVFLYVEVGQPLIDSGIGIIPMIFLLPYYGFAAGIAALAIPLILYAKLKK